MKNRKKDEDEEAGIPQRIQLPEKGEIFGIVEHLLGASKMKVICADGKSRLARIPGKIKKKLWIRQGDLVILKPWDFQDEKADIVWRYTRTQAKNLKNRGLLPEQISISIS